MKRWIMSGLVAVSLLSAVVAQAAEFRFAYVDVPRAIASSDAAKKARDLLKKKLESKQREVDKLETEIKNLKEDLEQRQSKMSNEARNELGEKVRTRIREYQRLAEDNQAAIDRENNQWTKKITQALGEVIEDLGKEKKYTTVFGKGQVLYAESSIDITDEVLIRLNQRTREWF